MSEDTDGPNYFRPQMVNVTKITKSIDCDILIEECLHSIGNIDNQLSDKSYEDDPLWRSDALRAKSGLVHKIKLLEMKKANLLEIESARKSLEERFAARFVKAAREMLPEAIFNELYREAGFDAAA